MLAKDKTILHAEYEVDTVEVFTITVYFSRTDMVRNITIKEKVVDIAKSVHDMF